jgi:3-dehydrosphinganine reductase
MARYDAPLEAPFFSSLGNSRQQTILLTGASEGMGKSVAKQLAAKGANILIVSRNIAKLEAALAEIKVVKSLPQLFDYV